jgi:hypothetical protein
MSLEDKGNNLRNSLSNINQINPDDFLRKKNSTFLFEKIRNKIKDKDNNNNRLDCNNNKNNDYNKKNLSLNKIIYANNIKNINYMNNSPIFNKTSTSKTPYKINFENFKCPYPTEKSIDNRPIKLMRSIDKEIEIESEKEKETEKLNENKKDKDNNNYVLINTDNSNLISFNKINENFFLIKDEVEIDDYYDNNNNNFNFNLNNENHLNEKDNIFANFEFDDKFVD